MFPKTGKSSWHPHTWPTSYFLSAVTMSNFVDQGEAFSWIIWQIKGLFVTWSVDYMKQHLLKPREVLAYWGSYIDRHITLKKTCKLGSQGFQAQIMLNSQQNWEKNENAGSHTVCVHVISVFLLKFYRFYTTVLGIPVVRVGTCALQRNYVV